jgi:hypothetical protein
MEIADIRRGVLAAIERARQHDAARRGRADEAARAYSTFLETLAVPLVRQIANVLKAEGYFFTVFTPAGGVKLASDRRVEDSIEMLLDSSGDDSVVLIRTSRARGRRVIESERPLGDPATLGEPGTLEALLAELELLLER